MLIDELIGLDISTSMCDIVKSMAIINSLIWVTLVFQLTNQLQKILELEMFPF